MAYFEPGMTDQGEYSPDQLVGGGHPIRTRDVTIASGQGVLVRGTVLGLVTASGKYILSASAAVDGSEVPTVILGDDVDATGADALSFAYEAGDFNSNSLILGTGHTVDSIRDGLRDKSIYLFDAVPA